MQQAWAENAQERNMKKKLKSLKKGVGSGSALKCQGSLTLEWVQGTGYLGAGGEKEAAHSAGLGRKCPRKKYEEH
jgi:hypothetical protein